MKVLDPIAAPLSGIHVIEASAGTGKTYNLTTLYLRMITEKNLPVSRILVVTYTEAAAAELRDRIRRRLREAYAALESGHSPDPLMATWAEALSVDAETRRFALTQVRSAMFGMDEAAIHTIHAFCSRLLRENAFETNVPFNADLITETTSFREEMASDFWRLLLDRYDSNILRMLLREGPTRDHFCKADVTALDARMATCLAPPEGGVQRFTDALQPFTDALQRLRHIHQNEGSKAYKLVCDAIKTDALHKGRYSEDKVTAAWQSLEALLGGDLSVSDDVDALKPFSIETLEKARRKGAPALEHPLFTACADVMAFSGACRESFRHVQGVVWQDYVHFLLTEQPQRKALRNIQFFDDLLLHVFEAASGEGGDAFSSAIRQRFPVALIDEFQDTDPVQWDIFKSVYLPGGDECALFLIGDPKQAIYRFRRADVYAYLRAREVADDVYTINRNFRSVPELIEAVNVLYSRHNPFREEKIQYGRVSSGRDADQHRRLEIEGNIEPPFHFLQMLPEEGTQGALLINKGDAEKEIGRCVGAEIARLVHLGSQGSARLGESNLMPRDVAVLVNTHRQGSILQEALKAVGVGSVVAGQDSVFLSREAHALRILLFAVVHCEQESRVRAALLTDFVGYTARELEQLGEDDHAWEATVECFRDVRDIWTQRGVAPAMEHFFREQSTRAKLLRQDSGDRRLTNLMHLVELMHRAASEQRMSQQDMLHWLAQKIVDAKLSTSEDELLRLESDADRVRIVTIHKSKGLEYPVVFCPFVWEAKAFTGPRVRAPITFHDHHTHSLVMDIGSADYDANVAHVGDEDRSEHLRLLYVALTRASARCYVVTGYVKTYANSALAYLLHGEEEPKPAAISRDLQVLVSTHPEVFQLQTTPAITSCEVLPVSDSDTPCVARALSQGEALPRGWRISSFTSLSAESTHAVVAQPDRDADDQSLPSLAARSGIHDFPAGTVPGTTFHAIFEKLDFKAGTSEVRRTVASVLAAYGFDAKWDDPVCEMVQTVLSETLADGFRLADLGAGQRLNELEFYLPLAGSSVVELERVLDRHGYGGALDLSDGTGGATRRLNGYMKGFVDLVCQVEDRFFIIDYKSNRLGTTREAYDEVRMAAEMTANHYRLQYLIYTCALHRYLGVRLGRDYDYERNMGGVYYLFVRGMGASEGGQLGVYRDRPDRACIEAMLDCFSAPAREGV